MCPIESEIEREREHSSLYSVQQWDEEESGTLGYQRLCTDGIDNIDHSSKTNSDDQGQITPSVIDIILYQYCSTSSRLSRLPVLQYRQNCIPVGGVDHWGGRETQGREIERRDTEGGKER